jgi:hypothetical protein
MPDLTRQDVIYLAISAALVVAYTVAVIVFNADPSPLEWIG